VLKFVGPLFDDLPADALIQYTYLKYESDVFSPTYTVGSKLLHLYFSSCQVYNSMEAKYTSPIEAPRSSEDVREGLGACGRARLVGLEAVDKIAFLDFYAIREGTTGGGYQKKE
jgi:hypothetical protein